MAERAQNHCSRSLCEDSALQTRSGADLNPCGQTKIQSGDWVGNAEWGFRSEARGKTHLPGKSRVPWLAVIHGSKWEMAIK